MKRRRNRIGDEYLRLSEQELADLPSENEDGLVFYEVGKVLMGKEALLRWVSCHKISDEIKKGKNITKSVTNGKKGK